MTDPDIPRIASISEQGRDEAMEMLSEAMIGLESGEFVGMFLVALKRDGDDVIMGAARMSYSEIIGRLEMIKLRE